MKKILFPVLMLMVFVVVACAKQSEPVPGVGNAPYKNISAQELKAVLETQKKDFVLIDVHIPEQKHIAGTDLVIPFNEIERNKAKFPADKTKKLVLYCRSGSMSQEAALKLADLGYTHVYNLEGGTYAWQAAGYPVE